MLWFWLGLEILVLIPLTVVTLVVWVYFHVRKHYLHHAERIFQEKPLFLAPRGVPVADAEEVRFPTADGLSLVGCYLRGVGPRRGVILFGGYTHPSASGYPENRNLFTALPCSPCGQPVHCDRGRACMRQISPEAVAAAVGAAWAMPGLARGD